MVLINENITYIDLANKSPEDVICLIQKLNPYVMFIAIKDVGCYSRDLGVPLEKIAELTKLIWVPYYGATLVDDAAHHTEHEVYKLAWKIIIDCPTYIDYLGSAGMSDKIINVGHPKLESLVTFKSDPVWPFENSNSRLKIIWAPHWSVPQIDAWPGGGDNILKFGTFLDNCWSFYGYAKANPDVQIVFKPHPLLQPWLDFEGLHGVFTLFLEKWNSLSNTKMVLSGLYGGLFLAADLMVTDGISFLVEWPIITEKPLIFIDNGKHCPFNFVGHLAEEYAHSVSSFSEIEKLFNNPSEIYCGSNNRITETLLPFGRKTSEKIVEILSGLCDRD